MKKLTLLFVLTLVVGSVFAYSTTVVTASCLDNDAKSAYVIDENESAVIYAQKETARLPIASITKIMLLNFVFEREEAGELSFDEQYTVSENASKMGGSQVFLQANKEYVVSDLVKSIIIASANDASVAMAERLFGSEQKCVEIMNERANEWGLQNTLFSNCTGLPKPTQYSCAKDVAVMFKHLIKHEKYFDYSKIWLDELVHPDGQKTTLTNTNKLSKYYQGCDGGKTGFTSDAGFCLVATAKRGNLRVISVYLGEQNSKQRFADVSGSFDYAFQNYTQKIVVDKLEEQKPSVKVSGGKSPTVFAEPEENVYCLMKVGEQADFKVEVNVYECVKAPLIKGDVVGEMIVYKDGVEYKKVNLVSALDVERRNYFDVVENFADVW